MEGRLLGLMSWIWIPVGRGAQADIKKKTLSKDIFSRLLETIIVICLKRRESLVISPWGWHNQWVEFRACFVALSRPCAILCYVFSLLATGHWVIVSAQETTGGSCGRTQAYAKECGHVELPSALLSPSSWSLELPVPMVLNLQLLTLVWINCWCPRNAVFRLRTHSVDTSVAS